VDDPTLPSACHAGCRRGSATPGKLKRNTTQIFGFAYRLNCARGNLNGPSPNYIVVFWLGDGKFARVAKTREWVPGFCGLEQ
jgi:hypothetical protein